LVIALMMKSCASQNRSSTPTGLALEGLNSEGTPLTKPISSRPRETTSMGERIAEHEEPRPLGDAREDRQRHHHGRSHAGGRAVMLVDHDVEAQLVGELPLVVVAMEEIAGELRVEPLVRDGDAERAAVILP